MRKDNLQDSDNWRIDDQPDRPELLVGYVVVALGAAAFVVLGLIAGGYL